MKNLICITGANSLLGINLVNHFIERGYLVRGFLRDKHSFQGEFHENLELIEGDILDVDTLINAFHNCQFVVHSAALTNQNLRKTELYELVNVQGFKNVLKVAELCYIKRLIYVSSANAFGFGSFNNPGNEETPVRYPFTESFYAKSKVKAQEIALSNNNIDVVVVNPTFMIGAYDTKPSSGRIVLLGMNNKFILSPAGGKNFVCVKDVVKGVENALKYGKRGEAYLLAGENLSYYDFFKLLRQNLKKRIVIIEVPKAILFMLGCFGSILQWCNIKTQLSINNAKQLCVNNYYSNHKSRAFLDMEYHSIEFGIKEAIHWFKEKKPLN